MRKLFLANNGYTSATSADHFISAHWADLENLLYSEDIFLLDIQGKEASLPINERIELCDALIVLRSNNSFAFAEKTAFPSPEYSDWIESVRNWKKPTIIMADTTGCKLKIGDFTHKIVATLATDGMFAQGNVVFFNEGDHDFYQAQREFIYCSTEGNLWRRKRSAEIPTYDPISKLLKAEMKLVEKDLRKQSF
ncbi:MAG: hypothetical protein DI585_05030 [Pseudomonas fluorescens]|nr:MAG: hypothetical protein DI585_05030 [Pseudomonas fluorescens]